MHNTVYYQHPVQIVTKRLKLMEQLIQCPDYNPVLLLQPSTIDYFDEKIVKQLSCQSKYGRCGSY